MNILFYVSSFLILLSILVASFSQSSISLSTEKTSIDGYCKGVIKTRNAFQNRLFVKATKPSIRHLTALHLKPLILKEISSHRISNNLHPKSKLNIKDLMIEDHPSEVLLNAAEALLKTLYQSPALAPLQEENWEKHLLMEMKKTAKKKKNFFSLHDLFPEKGPYQQLFYKLLKGSGYYDLSKLQGFPPMRDFFVIDMTEKKSIQFHYASKEVLSAVLGKDIVEKIIEKEMIKAKQIGQRVSLSKQDLFSLIQLKPQSLNSSMDLEEIFNFSKSNITLCNLVYKDPKAEIFYRLPI
ncbi:MAG: hypothetical protein EBZ47_01030 [Chlamydiae bacterium]|nr:hypothetical protein [Chlamydiota bacterium]